MRSTSGLARLALDSPDRPPGEGGGLEELGEFYQMVQWSPSIHFKRNKNVHYRYSSTLVEEEERPPRCRVRLAVGGRYYSRS